MYCLDALGLKAKIVEQRPAAAHRTQQQGYGLSLRQQQVGQPGSPLAAAAAGGKTLPSELIVDSPKEKNPSV